METNIANVLTVAGSDSGGGAGIQADLKTFSALGTYGASVITALTAQNTKAVTGIHGVPADFVRKQLDAVFEDIRIDAVKIGMLGPADVVETVASFLGDRDVPVVVDPVMVAKSGDRLLQAEAVATLRTALVPRATVLTPNVPEAGDLLERDPPASEVEMVEAGRALLALGPKAVLMKGGHLDGVECVDVIVTPEEVRPITGPRVDTPNTHGTGCTLSSALAAELAKGRSIFAAAEAANAYVRRAIQAADQLDVGKGRGPVHHFAALWSA